MSDLFSRCGGLAVVLVGLSVSSLAAEEFHLARDGKPAALIHAPGDNDWAGLRLANRVQRWTGVSLPVHTRANLLAGRTPVVAIGSPRTNAVVHAVLGNDPRLAELGDEGFILETTPLEGRQILVVAGLTLAGVHNGVSELISWNTHLTAERATVPDDLHVSDSPALKYRVLWSTIGAAWAPTFEETVAIAHNQAPNSGAASAEGAIDFCKRAIDYCSDHKLNGLMIYYLINTKIGGLASAQEICRHARRNNVRVLLGVATMSSYHGFAASPDFEFTFKHWNAERPDLRVVRRDGEFGEGICPSRPANHEWLRRGTRWLFERIPDLGGVNVENGDWILCWCDQCKANRNDPRNDPNFFYDQMASYRPVLEEMDALGVDAWQTFATYSGFSENAIGGAMHGAIQTRRAEGPSTRIVYPPRFLQHTPPNAVCQWTLTGMASPQAWPDDHRPPPGSFRDHVGFTHHGSPWWGPVDPDRWWADPSRGSMWDDTSELLRFLISRTQTTGMTGMVAKGMAGHMAPARDLSYVALEYFSWHPERSYQQFIDDRLSVHVGGPDLARRFLAMLRNTTSEPDEIDRDRQQADQIAADEKLDVRQRLRWGNLSLELERRASLAREMAVAQQADQRQPEIRPQKACDGSVIVAESQVDTDSGMLRWGKNAGKPVVAVGIHALPFGKTAPDVLKATLRIPLTDSPATDDTSAAQLNMLVNHIDADDDQRVTLPDATSPVLNTIGVYRAPDPTRPSFDRFVAIDVTQYVKADLAAQRTTFTWRVEPESVPDGVNSQLCFPAVECANSSFPADNLGARLRLEFQDMAGPEP